MAFKIGFSVSEEKEKITAPEPPDVSEEHEPRRSVVRVQFPQRNMTLAYYNDRFDLHCGDLVYVDGKLEGKRGRVVDVNYNFRINLADYKRVIGVADTNVSGRFTLAGSHVLTFDRAALPRRKVMSWYKAPSKPDTEYACGSDDSTFPAAGAAPDARRCGGRGARVCVLCGKPRALSLSGRNEGVRACRGNGAL